MIPQGFRFPFPPPTLKPQPRRKPVVEILQYIRRLHQAEIGRYRCYICDRIGPAGADSYLEMHEVVDGAPVYRWSMHLCQRCIRDHKITGENEWVSPSPPAPLVPKRTSEESTPDMYAMPTPPSPSP